MRGSFVERVESSCSVDRRAALRRLWRCGAALVASVCVAGGGAPGEFARAAKPSADEAASEELFAAIKSGAVEARVVARDPHHMRVFLKNATDRPLSVKLPAVLAARPVLAQNFFNPGQGQGQAFGMNNSTSSAQQPQAVGGPTSGTARTNGIFNIPPESVREMRLDTMCLEHGKPNPRSSVAYELAKLEDVCAEPAVESLLVRYGQGGLDRETVQAAAWNLANGLAWRDLENMTEPVAINAVKPVYSAEQLQTARRLAESAKKEIAARKTPATKIVTVEGQAIEAAKSAEPKLQEYRTINARK